MATNRASLARMKSVCLSLAVMICAGCSSLQSADKETSTGFQLPHGMPILEVQIALRDVKYPISLDDLYEKLGGDRKLIGLGGGGEPKEEGYRLFERFKIKEVKSGDGDYLIECDIDVGSLKSGGHMVKKARVLFRSDQGIFYADNQFAEKPTKQPVAGQHP